MKTLLGAPTAAVCALLTLVVTLVLLTRPTAGGDDDGRQALLAGLGELRRSQQETVAVLRGIQQVLAEGRLPAAATPTEGGASTAEAPVLDGAALEALTASVDALRLSLERQRDGAYALETLAAGPAGESLARVRDRQPVTNWGRLDVLAEYWQLDEREADRSQYFQTPRDLLETYGPPTAIYRPKDGLLFSYRRQPEGEPGPVWYFRLKDGIVIEFFVEHEAGGG